MDPFQEAIEDWKEAASDLGLRVIFPFELELKGKQVAFAALVQDFGARNGMLVYSGEFPGFDSWPDAAVEAGYGYSSISGRYDRSQSIDALNNWGWKPQDRPPPPWYTG